MRIKVEFRPRRPGSRGLKDSHQEIPSNSESFIDSSPRFTFQGGRKDEEWRRRRWWWWLCASHCISKSQWPTTLLKVIILCGDENHKPAFGSSIQGSSILQSHSRKLGLFKESSDYLQNLREHFIGKFQTVDWEYGFNFLSSASWKVENPRKEPYFQHVPSHQGVNGCWRKWNVVRLLLWSSAYFQR